MFDTKIVFRDGSVMTLTDCEGYKIDKENKVFSVQKNGSNHFFNFCEIVYAGVASDLEPLPSAPESTV